MLAGDEALSILSNAGHVSPVGDSLGASWANAGTAEKENLARGIVAA